VSGRGHLRLRLKGGETTAPVEIDLVGTKRIYLGAYDIGSGDYHGSIDASPKLLRWLEAAARRVRKVLDKPAPATPRKQRTHNGYRWCSQCGNFSNAPACGFAHAEMQAEDRARRKRKQRRRR
jgi:hypothetical protein